MGFAHKPDPVDVIVVGVGATGGTAAKVLCEAGLKVVGLEKGPWLRPEKHEKGQWLRETGCRHRVWGARDRACAPSRAGLRP